METGGGVSGTLQGLQSPGRLSKSPDLAAPRVGLPVVQSTAGEEEGMHLRAKKPSPNPGEQGSLTILSLRFPV